MFGRAAEGQQIHHVTGDGQAEERVAHVEEREGERRERDR
jgi:hypothetical protein